MSASPFANTYSLDQCTRLVADAFAWVGHWGDGGNWLNAARSSGVPTGNAPMTNSIAVWDRGLPGSNGAGHVAVVTKINSDGSFQVRERNWSVAGGDDSRTVHTYDPYLIGFIYPPGTTGNDIASSYTASQNDPCAGSAPGVFNWQVPIPHLNIAGHDLTPPSLCIYNLDGLVGTLMIVAGMFTLGLAVLVIIAPKLRGVLTVGAATAVGGPGAGAVAGARELTRSRVDSRSSAGDAGEREAAMLHSRHAETVRRRHDATERAHARIHRTRAPRLSPLPKGAPPEDWAAQRAAERERYHAERRARGEE